jgi:hypothetical protein
MGGGMGFFATFARLGAQAEVAVVAVLVESAQQVLPARFEAVGERLSAGYDVRGACVEVGRMMARDGADLGEALDGLRTTYARVLGGEPDFRALRALCQAWSEETLGYLHQISCENPLTGLASLAHLRARVSEVYRDAEQGGVPAGASHALVVVDVSLLGGPPPVSPLLDPFAAALWTVRLAEQARLAFPGGETIGQVSPRRLVVLAPRSDLLARRTGMLRDLVEDLGPDGGRARVWTEGLPSSDHAAGSLIDELARVG